MRCKIAMSLVAGLAMVGCGNSNNSSSSSAAAASNSATNGSNAGSSMGSSGATGNTPTNGTNGTNTGATGGSGGTTGGNNSTGAATGTNGGSTGGVTCLIDPSKPAVDCLEGQSCETFGVGTNVGAYKACVCNYVGEALSDGGANAVDSCSGDLDGNTVCDPFTFQCRAPRDQEPCNLNPASSAGECDPNNYTCVMFVDQTGADAGQLCLQVCMSPTDCTSNSTTCAPNQLTATLQDGGMASFGACIPSQCGLVVEADGGVVDGGDYYGPCTNRTSNDGTCLPFPSNANPPGLVGQCFVNGPVAPLNGQCNNETVSNPNLLCSPGDFCLLTGLAPGTHLGNAIATALCFPMCNLNASPDAGYDVGCPSITGIGQTSCMQLFNTPASFNPNPNPGACE